MNRLGYLVPEFPGQTHIFFWRELQSLAALGVQCDLVSTRLPSRQIISHSWSQEAIARTTYLSPPTLDSLLSGLGAVLVAGPRRWWNVLRTISQSNVGTFRKKLRLFALAAVGAQLAAIARRRHWRHLHVHSCGDSAHIALFAHLLGGISYSLTLHGPLEDYGPNQPMKWRHAAFAIVITRKLLDQIHATLDGSLPAQIEIAPMGVDISAFHREGPYQPWDGTGPLRIFSCGRLNPCKGHDDLIRAVAQVRGAGIDARLQIAGADDSLGLYLPVLKHLIDELKLGDSVTLVGAVSEAEVRAGINAAHIFALGSLHEPLGVAIMEAMAMAMPVVVTKAGGVPELVDDGADGILVEPRNPADFASALQRVARDPSLARSLAAAARIKIETSFQSDQSARVLLRCLEAVG